MTPQAKCKEIVEEIHALFGDKSVSKETTQELMEEIAEAAQMNADAIQEELKAEAEEPDDDDDDDDDEDDDC